MKYFIVITSLIIVYGIFYTVRIFYYANFSPLPYISNEPKLLGVGENLKYIASGDSTSVGVGASSYKQTYAFRLAEALSLTKTVNYINIGVSGAKTSDFIKDQLPVLIEEKPDIITISIGANDLTHLVSSKTIINNYQYLTQNLQTKTSATIYITNIPNFSGAKLLPFWYRKILEYKARNINEQLSKLENDRIKIVNIHDFGWSSYKNISETYAQDNFHPNDRGYDNWANAFLSRF